MIQILTEFKQILKHMKYKYRTSTDPKESIIFWRQIFLHNIFMIFVLNSWINKECGIVCKMIIFVIFCESGTRHIALYVIIINGLLSY